MNNVQQVRGGPVCRPVTTHSSTSQWSSSCSPGQLASKSSASVYCNTQTCVSCGACSKSTRSYTVNNSAGTSAEHHRKVLIRGSGASRMRHLATLALPHDLHLCKLCHCLYGLACIPGSHRICSNGSSAGGSPAPWPAWLGQASPPKPMSPEMLLRCLLHLRFQCAHHCLLEERQHLVQQLQGATSLSSPLLSGGPESHRPDKHTHMYQLIRTMMPKCHMPDGRCEGA